MTTVERGRSDEIIECIEDEYGRRVSEGLDPTGFHLVPFLMARFGDLADDEMLIVADRLQAMASREFAKADALEDYVAANVLRKRAGVISGNRRREPGL